jgi:hypothetical protein
VKPLSSRHFKIQNPKSKIQNRLGFLASLALVFFSTGALAQQTATIIPNAPANGECSPLGRVLSSSDRRWLPGKLLCKGDSLNATPGARITLLCFRNRRILSVQSDRVALMCAPQVQNSRTCPALRRSNCWRTKGPEDVAQAPQLLEPRASILLRDRPLLSWQEVEGATGYTVEVKGEGVNFFIRTASTQLVYPQTEPPMQRGNAYRIVVAAYRGENLLGVSQGVANVLPAEPANRVAAVVAQIRKLKLPEDEMAYLDLDAVYMSEGLLDDAIAVLEARVKAGSQNPGVYRVLGDRYGQAGDLIRAKDNYQVASRLATQSGNQTELALAQSGLKNLETDGLEEN